MGAAHDSLRLVLLEVKETADPLDPPMKMSEGQHGRAIGWKADVSPTTSERVYRDASCRNAILNCRQDVVDHIADEMTTGKRSIMAASSLRMLRGAVFDFPMTWAERWHQGACVYR